MDARSNADPKLAEALFRMVGWEEPVSPPSPTGPKIAPDDRRSNFAVAARRLLLGGDEALEPLVDIPGFVAAAFIDMTSGRLVAGRNSGRGLGEAAVAKGLSDVLRSVSAWTDAMGGVELFGTHDAIVISTTDGMIAIRVVDDRYALAVVTDLDNPEETRIAITQAVRSIQPRLRRLVSGSAGG